MWCMFHSSVGSHAARSSRVHRSGTGTGPHERTRGPRTLAARDNVDDSAVDATDVSHRGEARVEGMARGGEDARSQFGCRELKPELPSDRTRNAQVDMGHR